MLLPTELLVPIFAEASSIGSRTDISSKNLCLYDVSTGDSRPLLPAPLNLVAVCRRWRAIALEMPELWTSFSISLDSKLLSAPTTLERLRCYIERSGERGMTIRIHGWYNNYNHKLPEVAPLMTTLSSSAHRWKELDLVSPSFLQTWNHSALSFSQLLDETVPYPNSTALQPQATLHSLTIGEPPDLSPESQSLSNHLFSSLISLTVTPTLYLHHLWYGGILSQCSATLADLTIELRGVPDEGNFHRWQVLPALRSLTIIAKWRKGNPKEALASIFNALVCPGLKRLEVRVETELPLVTKRGQWPSVEAAEFLAIAGHAAGKDGEERCKGNEGPSGLEELILVSAKITAQELADLLKATPGLKKLVFDGQTTTK
ncbi:hypothetical protein V5O48_004856 [Marasmius crinis-equi]|uniref:F-box domain-containing protein n=1 Tax=Marasmius crinis-equi TaxID=585013 RepID=A0ABR3FNY1_9AGAR